MALVEQVVEQKRTCDVYGITRGTKTIKIQVVDEATGTVLHERLRDLSVRGVSRLKRYIARGLGKPGYPWDPEASVAAPTTPATPSGS